MHLLLSATSGLVTIFDRKARSKTIIFLYSKDTFYSNNTYHNSSKKLVHLLLPATSSLVTMFEGEAISNTITRPTLNFFIDVIPTIIAVS